MRIIDKNTDFYDYLQYVYPDNTFTFDRRDSFILTKDEFARYFRMTGKDPRRYIMLQICNTFWLFLLTITKTDNCGICLEYDISLVGTWKDYSVERKMLELSHVEMSLRFLLSAEWREGIRNGFTRSDNCIAAIKNGDYDTEHIWNHHTIYKGCRWNDNREERHIPILSEIGIAGVIDHLEVYLALDEFFSKEKQSTERTESVGITNDEKITNHGFNLKDSFRGKHKTKL